MGFLSGLSQTLFGGSNSGSLQQSTSGFSLLPSEIQNAYKNYGTAVNQQIPNATAAYTPMPLTSGEQSGLDRLTQGFAPTQDSLNSDVSMLMNPFNSSVIDQINRQSQGDFSILKQNLNQAGQFGSNRQQLGANDIENTRESNIGSLLQNQYNTALGQIFNNLIPQRQQDAQNALNAGTYERQLASQTAQAPITGLQQIGQALGILPSNGGSQSTGTTQSSTSNGIFKQLSL
jgi:hypothetical protein